MRCVAWHLSTLNYFKAISRIWRRGKASAGSEGEELDGAEKDIPERDDEELMGEDDDDQDTEGKNGDDYALGTNVLAEFKRVTWKVV